MGKKGQGDAKPKKSQIAKKKEIDKLVESSRKKVIKVPTAETKQQLERTPPSGRPTVRFSSTSIVSSQQNGERSLPRPPPPPPLLPLTSSLINDAILNVNFLILDRRDHARPEIGLIRLPGATTCKPFKIQGQFPFLELPGEIRNKIYDLVIPSKMYDLDWLDRTQRSKSLTHRVRSRQRHHPQVRLPWVSLSDETKDRRKNFRQKPSPEKREALMEEVYNQASPTALLLVNRTMHAEAASIFYAKSTFHFSLLGTLRHFLNTLTPVAKTAIRKLGITHHTYGYPSLRVNQRWKDRADMAWDDLCWRVSDELPSLTHLILDLRYRNSALIFPPLAEARYSTFGAQWLMPLWAFQGIGLKTCWLRVRSDVVEEEKLARESQQLRRQILEGEWDEEEQMMRRDAFGSRRFSKSVVTSVIQPGGEGVLGMDYDGAGDITDRANGNGTGREKGRKVKVKGVLRITRNGQVETEE